MCDVYIEVAWSGVIVKYKYVNVFGSRCVLLRPGVINSSKHLLTSEWTVNKKYLYFILFQGKGGNKLIYSPNNYWACTLAQMISGGGWGCCASCEIRLHVTHLDVGIRRKPGPLQTKSTRSYPHRGLRAVCMRVCVLQQL